MKIQNILIVSAIFLILLSSISIVSADDLQFGLNIWNTQNTTTRGDDVLIFNQSKTCVEGDDKDTCRFGENLTTLETGQTYLIIIKINVSELDYNYDADASFNTMLVGDKISASQCNNGTWASTDGANIPEFILTTNFVPTDSGSTADIFFTTNETCSECDENVDYTNDSLTFEDRIPVCFTQATDFRMALDYSGSEKVALDSDPESANTFPLGDANTDSFENTNEYFLGAIFTVDNDWIGLTSDSQYVHLGGEAGDTNTEVGWSWLVQETCDENWILNSTECNILDNQTIQYFDGNSCGTFDDLPANNGTIAFCDFCSQSFQCTVFDNSCGGSVSTLNCLATSPINQTCCDTTNLSSDCFFAGNLSFFELICGVLDLTLVVPTFPYVDFNTTYPMELIFTQNNITVNLTDFRLNLTDPNGNTSQFDFVLDISTQTYKLNLLFIEEGDFPFRIFALSPYDNIPNIVGTLIVRKPYFITFRAFEEKNSRFFGRSNIGAYKNKFAVLTAELRRTKKIRFDPILEHYITPLFFATSFNTSVFSAEYDNGEAVLKLWETGEYGFRLIDARSITFDGVFVVPDVTDTYGLNAFVGIFTFNGTDETVEVFFDEKDTNQYRWLFNLIFVISLVLIIATSVFLFFVIPEHANISILFGLGFTTMLILFRIFIFIWRGW